MQLGFAQFSFCLFRLPHPLKHTHTHTAALQFCWHWRKNRREGSGGWGKQAEREGLGRGLTNESRQVTFTDVKGWRGRRGRR